MRRLLFGLSNGNVARMGDEGKRRGGVRAAPRSKAPCRQAMGLGSGHPCGR